MMRISPSVNTRLLPEPRPLTVARQPPWLPDGVAQVARQGGAPGDLAGFAGVTRAILPANVAAASRRGQ
jgi:hypothetical protein